MNYPSEGANIMTAEAMLQQRYQGGVIAGQAKPMQPMPCSSVSKDISEVDAALSEHANLLDELSSLAIGLKSTFGPVLKPENETGCGAPIGNSPVASPLADRINGQNDLLRSILTDLRSIRDRSAV